MLTCDRCQKVWNLPPGQDGTCPACRGPLGPAPHPGQDPPAAARPAPPATTCPRCGLRFPVAPGARGARCPQCQTPFPVRRPVPVLWILVLVFCGLAFVVALFAAMSDRTGGLGPVTAPAWAGAVTVLAYVVARAAERLQGR